MKAFKLEIVNHVQWDAQYVKEWMNVLLVKQATISTLDNVMMNAHKIPTTMREFVKLILVFIIAKICVLYVLLPSFFKVECVLMNVLLHFISLNYSVRFVQCSAKPANQKHTVHSVLILIICLIIIPAWSFVQQDFMEMAMYVKNAKMGA